MNNLMFTGTYSTSGTLVPPPKGVVRTFTVRLMAGYVGQVIVDGAVVFETKPKRTPEKAAAAANRAVAAAHRKLFGGTK